MGQNLNQTKLPYVRSFEEEEEMEDVEYGWGAGSVIAMLVVVACLLFMPLGMISVAPPSLPLIVVIPVLLIVMVIFLSHASNPNY